EGDDDRGGRERQRHRVAHVVGGGVAREGGEAGGADDDEQEQIGGVAEQQEADEHAREAAFEHRVDAAREEHSHDDDEHEGDGHRAPAPVRPSCFAWRSTSAPRLRSTSSTRPITTRYTPMSKIVEVTNSMWPTIGSSASQ